MVTVLLGLLQGDVDLVFGRVDQAAIHFDVVAFQVGFGAEFGDHGAVDRDAAFQDDLLGLPAGGHAGLRENLLEPLFGH